MIGLWLEDGELRLADDLPDPVPTAGEALVRVTTAGICNTDLEMVRGYYPFAGVLGHEFVGIVEAAPPGSEALVSRRVVGEINAVCGSCETCAAGRRSHCPHRTVLGIVGRNGAFAERLTLPVENLHAVPETVADDDAVFVEPLAAALEIREQVHIDGGDRVLVVGDGKLGQLIARVLSRHAEISVAGRHPAKLALLERRGLATLAVDAAGGVDLVPGDFDVVVECTGVASGFEIARRAVRPRGILVLKSTYGGELTLDASRLVVDEITLVGSRCGPFAAALELLEAGAVEVGDLIAGRFALEEGTAAFEAAAGRGTLKILLDIG